MIADDGLQNALKELEPRAVSESKCEEIWALDQGIGHGRYVGRGPLGWELGTVAHPRFCNYGQ